jgi:hypothetical protein
MSLLFFYTGNDLFKIMYVGFHLHSTYIIRASNAQLDNYALDLFFSPNP